MSQVFSGLARTHPKIQFHHIHRIHNTHRRGSTRGLATADAMTQFVGTTVPDLEQWLQARDIDTALFGKDPSTKTLQALLNEVADGESILTSVGPNLPPSRRVSIVNVILRNSRGQQLIEAQQVLPSGAVRRRGLPLSEKMLPGEEWKDAMRRGVMEELGSIIAPEASLQIVESTYVKREERKESQSYPGLQTLVSIRYCLTSLCPSGVIFTRCALCYACSTYATARMPVCLVFRRKILRRQKYGAMGLSNSFGSGSERAHNTMNG